MKKLIIVLSVASLFSCKKDEVTTNEVVAEECKCGIIYSTSVNITNNGTTYSALIYNNCTTNDTTVNYMPQTNSGEDKGEGEPHCLGVGW
jgi:hypothetical protein